MQSAKLRDMVRQKKVSMEEGTLMRTLLFMPGGLELHIGVSFAFLCASYGLSGMSWSPTFRSAESFILYCRCNTGTYLLLHTSTHGLCVKSSLPHCNIVRKQLVDGASCN